ncbi:hypothetical protein C7Y68_06605 [Paracidovorax avenae]|uniref:COG4648 family protein n=1 Tax=Paracidovorax avenae TaxID=80867 RepID=UPI000D173040|nr:hypothetical protein [Paracidovorax avenae]AVT19730.1 hypothetical protein C7Y68_06605 [Paracidovorax avenae]
MALAPLWQALPWIAYPGLIYFGLQYLEPRYVALLLAATLLLRQREAATRFLSGLSRMELLVPAGLLAWSIATGVANNETMVRLYPCVAGLGMLCLFGASLVKPPTMVERFARLREPDLPPAGVRYTRHVTQVWCGFFVLNGAAACYTALYTSREVWSLYNGLIAYVLMGALFAGEWLVRQRMQARIARRTES